MIDKAMLYIFLGPDEYSKKRYVDSLVKEKRADLAVYGENEEISLFRLLESDLFFKAKVFYLNDISLLSPSPRPGEGRGEVDVISKLISSSNHIIVSVKSLDKRKKETKELLANKKIVVKEFNLPHGSELDKWITNRVKELGAQISAEAAGELAARLGRDQAKETKVAGKIVAVEEVYSLWQAENEINKLISHAGSREITVADVTSLVLENGETDVLSIMDALTQKDRKRTFSLIDRFLKYQATSDQKAGVIQLNALLAEQFRNIAMIQDFLANKTLEEEILEVTGWKPGRLFVIKKIAARFENSKVLDLLNKLAALDEEIKTSQTPARVLIDLILAQIL